MSPIDLRVLMLTSAWPSAAHPELVPFLVDQADSLKKLGIKLEVHSFQGGQNPIHYGRSWLQLRRKLHSQSYDLIHAQFGQSGLVALPSRLPMVVTFHGSDLQGWIGRNGRFTLAGKILRQLSRQVSRRASQVILVARHLSRHLPKNISFHVIPCGIDLRLFKPHRQDEARHKLLSLGLVDWPSGKKWVLFAGDPNNPIKRFDLARQACELAKDFCSRDGPSRLQAPLELVVAHRIPHRIMPWVLNACDALLLSSRHEGSPTVIKEALACNLPVVSTNVGDVSELLAGRHGSFVCSDDRPETLASSLAQALQLNNRDEGRRAVENLDLPVIAQRLVDVYQLALKNQPP